MLFRSVFISGILFIVIIALGIREAIIRAIPDCVKTAITPGIGLFITIIGVKSCGLIVGHPTTLVSMIDFAKWTDFKADMALIMSALLSLICLCIMAILFHKKVRGSILISMIITTLVGIPLGVTQLNKFDLNLANKFADFAEVSLFKLDTYLPCCTFIVLKKV